MGSGAIAAIVVAVVLVAVLGAALLLAGRRRNLRRHFGPEYERVASERNSRLAADAELAQRERRVRQLKIRPRMASAAVASFLAAIGERQESLLSASGRAASDGNTEQLRSALQDYRTFCQTVRSFSGRLTQPVGGSAR